MNIVNDVVHQLRTYVINRLSQVGGAEHSLAPAHDVISSYTRGI